MSCYVNTPGDFAIVLVGFVLLAVWRALPLVVIVINARGEPLWRWRLG